jgi:hypothetical protein
MNIFGCECMEKTENEKSKICGFGKFVELWEI